jgi:ATP-dependent Lon protease
LIIKDYAPYRELPVVPLRGLVVFPESRIHFEVTRESSVAALKAAMQEQQEIFVVAQKQILADEPDQQQLYAMGVIGTVRQVLRVSSGEGARVYVEGQCRALLKELPQTSPYLRGIVAPKADRPIKEEDRTYELALLRRARQFFQRCAQHLTLPPDIPLAVHAQKSAGKLANFIADCLPFSCEDKQALLEENDALRRLEQLCVLLAKEHELQLIQHKIDERVQSQIEQNQREMYLREQRRAITQELGEGEDAEEETDSFREQIVSLHLPDESEEKLLKDCARLERMSPQSPESSLLSTYLETVLSLPWKTQTKDRLNIPGARKVLDRDHYGLEKVKQRILELLAVRKLSPDITGQIICLVGPPGVGKTSVAKSVAAAMHRKFARISLGGVRDEAEIRGHRKTYIGAMPGRIITALQQAKSSNALILLDEVDKLCGDFRGDPAAALLEALDGEQNSHFRDHYIEIPFDLSRVLFLTTANDASAIPAPLRDRMELIELSSYTMEEKFHIARSHLLPKQLEKHGLTKRQLRLSDEAIRALTEGYTREAGVRKLERRLAELCRKCAVKLVEDENYRLSVKPEQLEELLGPRKYKPDYRSKEALVGVVNGLAWTSVGGDMMPIEALLLEGTGKVQLTGSLGDVMKESAQAAVSYLRCHAKALALDPAFYKEKDIHIHVPEGAVPKDGPSAGVTIFTALLSALSGRKVNASVAMTGEITLTGRILPIGGLREKAMAAFRADVRQVLIPEENMPDLEDVDAAVKEAVEFIGVSHLSQLPEYALLAEPASAEPEPLPPQKKAVRVPPARRTDAGTPVPVGTKEQETECRP